MVDLNLIAHLDQLAANAWPAREQIPLGGWILRANDGITRRANSVFPNGRPPSGALEDAIGIAIDFYRERDITPKFQMTRASQPDDLDSVLDERGFEIEMNVAIETTHIDNLISHQTHHDTRVDTTPTDSWLDAFARAGGYNEFSVVTRRGIMMRIQPAKAFASTIIDGEIAGVGLGVLEDGWLGLFAIVTLKDYQRRGVATAINRALGIWAKGEGASRSYLQVEVDNYTAIDFYKRIGFERQYEYWYRLLE
ncbi:MAG: GNAT family N-acetyltransferase [Candidatus Thorarchaeota archaeon]